MLVRLLTFTPGPEQVVAAAARLFTAAGPGCLAAPCPEGPMSCGAIGEVREEYVKL